MKRVVTSLILLLCSMILFAGPFGLEMGWTYDEIISSGAKKLFGDETLLSVIPVKPHSDLDSYLLLVDEEYGLYSIMAMGEKPFGLSGMLVMDYNDIKDQLIQSYGEPSYSDDTNFEEEDFLDVVDRVENGDKNLSCSWTLDDLHISLMAYMDEDGTQHYSLDYYSSKILDLITARDDAKDASAL